MKALNRLQLYPLVKVAAVLILGITLGDRIGHVLPLSVMLGLTILSLAVSLGSGRWPQVQSFMILVTVLFVGMLCLVVKKEKMDIHLPESVQSTETVVVSTPLSKGKILQCDLYVLSGSLCGKKVKASFLRDTIENHYQSIQLGSGIRIQSFFTPVTSFYPHSHFDYCRWMKIYGYDAQTFVNAHNWQTMRFDTKLLPRIERLKLAAQRVRANLLEQYDLLGLADQDYAIVSAMTLGDKSLLSNETKKVYSISGASHVLALSGLHLSIIFGLLAFVFGGKGSKGMMHLVAILLAIWIYVFLTGMSSSVMRSAIMLTFYTFISMLHREKTSLNALALTAIVMLLWNPLSLWDISFQMSFMAVFAILLLYQFIAQWIPQHWLSRSSVIGKMWGTIAVSLAAQAGTAPLVAYYFGRFSSYFLVTNLIAIPLTIVILYVSATMFALSIFPLIQRWVAWGLSWLSQLLNDSLAVIASWPGASVENIHLNLVQVILIYGMIGMVLGLIYFIQKGYRQSLNYSTRGRDACTNRQV